MTMAVIIRLALLAMEQGLPLVLTIMEKDLNKKVEDMTTEEMVKALDEIRISDTEQIGFTTKIIVLSILYSTNKEVSKR